VSIDGLLLDMDGVLTVSWEPLSGAVETVARLHARRVPMRVMTNTTSKSRSAIAEELRRSGFEFADDEVLTAAVAASEFLREAYPDARVFLLGDARPEGLDGVHLVALDEDPDVVLVSGADPSFNFETLNGVLRVLLGGASLVAMHRTLTWMTREGECLDAGAYLPGLEQATGQAAAITGKPARAFFDAGLRSLGLPAGRVAMVGDDVVNDVLGAQSAGITGVLVRTGKFREDSLARAGAPPDHVIESVAGVLDLLED